MAKDEPVELNTDKASEPPAEVAAPPELWEASKTSLTSLLDNLKCRLGELLVAAHKINPDQLNKALIYQKKNGGLLGQILRSAKLITDLDLSQALMQQHVITTVTLRKARFTIEAVEAIPPNICRNLRLLPFELVDNMLCVAMANCLDGEAVGKLRNMTKHRLKLFDCSWTDIQHAMSKCFVQRNEIPNIVPTLLVRDTDLLINNNWEANPVEMLAMKITVPDDIHKEITIEPIHVEVQFPKIAVMVDRQELQELVKGSLFDTVRKWEIAYGSPGPFQPKQMAG